NIRPNISQGQLQPSPVQVAAAETTSARCPTIGSNSTPCGLLAYIRGGRAPVGGRRPEILSMLRPQADLATDTPLRRNHGLPMALRGERDVTYSLPAPWRYIRSDITDITIWQPRTHAR